MKRFFNILSLVCVAMMALSCYDDTEVRAKITNLETQLSELTTQVNSVAAIVTALEQNNYIKAVTEVAGGYEIEFTKGEKITIKDGKDGADAPEIGAVKDADGIYYWTLDGEWLYDADDNKVPAGMGQPKFKTENGQWYISADGKAWALIGPNVACTIKDVAVAEEAVTFTLANDEKVVIPIIRAMDVTFDIPEEVVYGTEELTFGYAITGGTEKNRVAAISTAGVATVTATDANTGLITITGLTGSNFACTVFVTDGVERTIFKSVKFRSGIFTTEEDEISLGFDEATVTIPVATTMEFEVKVECDWITLPVETKAEVRTEEIVLNVAANTEMPARSTYVSFVPKDEAAAAMAFKVAVFQDGHAKKVWSKEVRNIEGYDATKPVRLAKYGDHILLANTTKVYVLNPVTGEALSTINMPEGVLAHNVLVDDAGNFMIAANGTGDADEEAGATDIILYLIPDPMNPVPEELLKYNTGNYYCLETGNFRVKGNIKDDAVITATVADGGSGAVILWEIVDGEFTEYTFDWGSRNWNYIVGPYSGWAVSTTCAAPVGTSLADGFFMIGYGGDYNLKYKVGEAEWATSYVTGSSWMENYNCISTATWKDNKYAAIVMGCHFNYDATDALLLDVNDPAAAKHVYTHNGDGDAAWDWGAGVNNSWTGAGTYSDVLLVPADDKLLMVYVDSNYGTLGCIVIQ